MNSHISSWLGKTIVKHSVWRYISTICFIQTLKAFLLPTDEPKREEMVDVLDTTLVDMKGHDQIKPNLARSEISK